LQNVNGLPVELHTHCTTGLGPLCCLEAIKLGVRSVNTATPPLADGSSNPSLFNVAMNARALGYTTAIDEEALKLVEKHFTTIAHREGLPIGVPAAYDHLQYVHQVPGGMISNFKHQLSKLGQEGRLTAVLEETVRVRAEFGYPIMVTPYSQFVGTQATMNVILGERYKVVSDQVIQYALGLWGEEESSSMEANVREKILSRPRAKELAGERLPQPSLQEVRLKYGGPGVSDDDLLLRYFAGKDDVDAMRAAPASKRHASVGYPILGLIEKLGEATNCNHVQVRSGKLSLTLKRRHGRS
jgi:oxaloacetate decarboxylase (Na+ extruding) subunit alpha